MLVAEYSYTGLIQNFFLDQQSSIMALLGRKKKKVQFSSVLPEESEVSPNQGPQKHSNN